MGPWHHFFTVLRVILTLSQTTKLKCQMLCPGLSLQRKMGPSRKNCELGISHDHWLFKSKKKLRRLRIRLPGDSKQKQFNAKCNSDRLPHSSSRTLCKLTLAAAMASSHLWARGSGARLARPQDGQHAGNRCVRGFNGKVGAGVPLNLPSHHPLCL